MKMYRATSYGTIFAIEVEKVTKTSVYIEDTSFIKRALVRREPITSKNNAYRPTWKEAHDWLLQYTEAQVTYTELLYHAAQRDHADAVKMEEPK